MKPFLRYTAGRLLFLPFALFIVVTLAFGIINLTPGDPAEVIAGGLASPEQVQEIRDDLGLDDPLGERYLAYLAQTAQLDLGQSYFTNTPISTEIAQRLPDSIELVVMGLIVAVLLGLLMGGLSAFHRGRRTDRALRLGVSAIQSVPDFFLGLLLIYFLFFLTGILPAPVGRIGLLDSPPPTVTDALLTDALLAGDIELFWTGLQHSVMPVLALGVFYSAFFAKTTRAVLGPAFDSKQVEFARACGLPGRTVLAYALRQARTPILTYGAILFASLVGGAAIVETVFAWGGLGQWAIDRILKLDVPAIQGFILVSAVLTLLTFLVLDVLVAALDPRISMGSESRS